MTPDRTAPRASRGAFWQRLRTGNLRDAEFGALLLAPAAALLLGIFLLPMLNVFSLTLRVQDVANPQIVNYNLGNFQRLFSDEAFIAAFVRTIWFGVLTVAGSFLVGLPLALLANVKTGWRWVVRIALLLPWAMPQVVTGAMFAWLFNSQYGLFNDLLFRLGFAPIYWFLNPTAATIAFIITTVWKTSSFVALILLGGLQSIPTELEEAARVDGATAVQIFWRITWPLLRPAIAVALIFRTLSALQVFDIPYAFMQNGASRSLETLGVYIQKYTVEFLDPGYGSTVSLSLFALALLITFIYVRVVRVEQKMKSSFGNRVFVFFALAVLVINGIYPLVWMLLTSLKTELELTAQPFPIDYLPITPQFGNYSRVFAAQPFAQYFLNSMIVAGASTLLCVVVATLAAYALSRLKLQSRGVISLLIIAASIFPVVSLIVPLYQAMLALGWLNTYAALIIPYAASSLPISILTLSAFFQGIPTELEDAAMVDGCSRFGALWRIIVPLSAPGVATAAILAFVNSWNEFLLALTFARSPNVKTIPPAIVDFQSQFGGFQWEVVSAAIIVAIIPVVVIILVFQQKIISGLTSGSVKG